MNPDFLETLVKLAAAGTSGICIFAIFAAGFILFKSNQDTPPAKYDALKSFMKMAAVVAVISAGTTIASGYWDHRTKVVLTNKNEQLAKTTKEQKQVLEKKEEAEEELVAQIEQSEETINSLSQRTEELLVANQASEAELARVRDGFLALMDEHERMLQPFAQQPNPEPVEAAAPEAEPMKPQGMAVPAE